MSQTENHPKPSPRYEEIMALQYELLILQCMEQLLEGTLLEAIAQRISRTPEELTRRIRIEMCDMVPPGTHVYEQLSDAEIDPVEILRQDKELWQKQIRDYRGSIGEQLKYIQFPN